MTNSASSMKIQLEHENHKAVANFLKNEIVKFNQQQWNVEKRPIAISFRDCNEGIVAGVSGVTFGNWLQLERLWVNDTLRGQGLGQQLLSAVEQEAKQRGCAFVFVDTLDFQAKPFYEKNGYEVQCTQEHYPITGARHYLIKRL